MRKHISCFHLAFLAMAEDLLSLVPWAVPQTPWKVRSTLWHRRRQFCGTAAHRYVYVVECALKKGLLPEISGGGCPEAFLLQHISRSSVSGVVAVSLTKIDYNCGQPQTRHSLFEHREGNGARYGAGVNQ